MLWVKFDATRPDEEGQFWVELVDIDHAHPENSPRTGYWCDLVHLETFLPAIKFAVSNRDAWVRTQPKELTTDDIYRAEPSYRSE